MAPTVVASTASPFKFCDNVLGALGETNLRDGLGISTPKIDHILEMALANGAYGGKINGSGGGGCVYCYAPAEKSDAILKAAAENGIPAKRLSITDGVRIEIK